MTPQDSQQGNAQTKPKAKKRQPVKKRDSESDKAATTLVIIGAVGAVTVGVLAYYHRDTLLVWTTFLTILFFLIAIYCHWRNQYVKWICAFAGIVLLFGCLIWQYRLLPKSEPLASPKLRSFTATPEPSASPSTTSTQEARVFLDIDPEKLLAFFDKYNAAQAETIVKPYIGKWLEISGRVSEVEQDVFMPPRGSNPGIVYGITVHMWTPYKAAPKKSIGTQAEFWEQPWIDRATVLKRNEDIRVRGQIKTVFSVGFVLEHCEIVE